MKYTNRTSRYKDGAEDDASNKEESEQETGVSVGPEYSSCYVRTQSGTA